MRPAARIAIGCGQAGEGRSTRRQCPSTLASLLASLHRELSQRRKSSQSRTCGPWLWPAIFSIFEDYIHRKRELIPAGSIVVRGTVIGMIESDFRTKQNGASHPVPPHQSLL